MNLASHGGSGALVSRSSLSVGTIRVASVPASHVYVRHLSDGPDGVARLADPVPADGCTVPGGWWPPLMLDPAWIDEHANEFDLFHVHFGFDAEPVERLMAVVQRLRRNRKPLVVTVHDLSNPHQAEQEPHRDRLAVLVPAADRVVTLTPGAARTIGATWDRDALVLPHPHVAPLPRIGRLRSKGDRFVVGVHAKSRRANMDPLPVLEVLRDVIPDLPGAHLKVNVHDEVFQPDAYWYSPDFGHKLLAMDADPHVDVHVHSYFDDEQFLEYLAALDLCVLPYRFGTHSGWLEACFDLGTGVVAPDCGFYAQQRPVYEFGFGVARFEPESLRNAVRAAYDDWLEGTVPAATRRARADERSDVARAHQRLYRELL